MARSVPLRAILDACRDALNEAEDAYSEWSGGITVRAAPESLVQTYIAQELAKLKPAPKLLLEASVVAITRKAEDLEHEDADANGEQLGGRLDLALYYAVKKTGAMPRVLIEVKKLTKNDSIAIDLERIRKLMTRLPGIQRGVLVGYTTRVNEATIDGLIKAQIAGDTNATLPVRVARKIKIRPAKSRKRKVVQLGGAVYVVRRNTKPEE